MNLTQKNIGSHKYGRILLGSALLAAAIVTAACNDDSSNKVQAAPPAKAIAQSAPVQRVASMPAATAKVVEAKSLETPAVKPQLASKVLRYRSRDYGVSFEYPWQYAFVNARTVSQDQSLQPRSDGHDGQITLARIDVPKGFYPDTDFDSGYFTVGLNPDLDENGCKAVLDDGKGGEPQFTKINGTDFFWSESNDGGKGVASKVRNYVAFGNGVCYEFELGVKTTNADGLAREVSPDRVMQRLDSMLKTVKIEGAETKPEELEGANQQPKNVAQK